LFSGILINIQIPFGKVKRGQATLFSYILINIRIPLDKEKRGRVWYSRVFPSIFEYPSTKRNEDKIRCSQVFSSTFEIPFDKTRNENGNDKCAMALSGIPKLRNTLSKLSILQKIQLKTSATVLLELFWLQACLEKT
jgi:hypothetical protein